MRAIMITAVFGQQCAFIRRKTGGY